MAKFKEREQALHLRKIGTSISDIALKLAVSKSTVSHWCKDVRLTQAAMQAIVSRSATKSTAALLEYTESLREKRQKDISTDKGVGRKQLGRLTERDIYCLGLGLYWGEGYKRGSQEFGFTNSDPQMVKFYIKWLEVVFGVTRENLILRVSINEAHKSRVSAVEKFWSQLTKVPLSNFTKVSLIKVSSQKKYSNSSSHMGTLRVKVRRGTRARRQVLGAIESISI